MAEITNGANGAFSGKIGSVIGSNWKKINYIRGISKRSTKAPTEAQLVQQAKFSTIVNFLSPLRVLLDKGFRDTGRASGYHVAVNYNLANAISGDYPDFSIDYSKILLSKGNLMSDYGLTALLTDGKLSLSWPPLEPTTVNAFEDDRASILVYNSSKRIHMISSGTLRSALNAEISIPAEFSGDTLEVFCFFTSKQGKSSTSTYLGSIETLS